MPSRQITRIIIVAAAIVVMALTWPIMGWQSILLALVIIALGLASDNSNRQRMLRNNDRGIPIPKMRHGNK